MFEKALIEVTYLKGQPGKLTKAHEKAEHHRFKSEYLFKDRKTPISPNIYALRLIQQLLIIKKLEIRLQSLSEVDKEEIQAFFTMIFLEQLWRTEAMEEDLRLLNGNPDAIAKANIAKATVKYLDDIDTFQPKVLLAHYLLHMAGFMHGGYIIQKTFIDPSNRLESHQIPSNQYDFRAAISYLESGKRTSIGVYNAMMLAVNTIPVNHEEYEEISAQCESIYEIMSDIYDDLCNMLALQSSFPEFSLPHAVLCLFVLGILLEFIGRFQDLGQCSGERLGMTP